MYPIYDVMLDDENENLGMRLISLVKNPAMEIEAVKLSQEIEPELVMLKTDEFKQILTSAVIIPNKLIPRNSEKLGIYSLRFSVEQINKIGSDFIQNGLLNLSNTNHDAEQPVDIRLEEIWYIQNPQNDKANALGFKNLPVGTLMASMRIIDKEYWNSQIMTNNVTGFSLEGFFNQIEAKLSLEQPEPAKEKSEFEQLMDLIDSFSKPE